MSTEAKKGVSSKKEEFGMHNFYRFELFSILHSFVIFPVYDKCFCVRAHSSSPFLLSNRVTYEIDSNRKPKVRIYF